MDQETRLLDLIRKPSDLSGLSTKEMNRLASEIRSEIIDVVNRNGGHLASNLGVVELTLALHRSFESPTDKIIWDVGHQCYTHKIITGRREQFRGLRQKNGISGFPKRTESVHDIVDTGHSSTSLSAGAGILVGQELQNTGGKVVAVIGDGALSGGMAWEALNNIGGMNENLIIILNDNTMSIAPNVGALSSYLSRITTTSAYQGFRRTVDRSILFIPRWGRSLLDLVERMKKAVKAVFFRNSVFADFGFEYIGPINGHNIALMMKVFKRARMLHKPVVVHCVTRKGRGYNKAEGNPTLYHGVSPYFMVEGKVERRNSLTYTEVFASEISEHGGADTRIAAVTAAMGVNTGLSDFSEKFPTRFFDVGITEQHAVTFAAGLAAAGMKPVVTMYSTFMQRAVDQFIHDVAIPGLPVVITLDRAGLVGADGETHQGVFDIALFRSVPGITFLSPACAEEMRGMLRYALDKPAPVLMRYARSSCPTELPGGDQPLEEGRGVFVSRHDGERDSRVLLIGLGDMVSQCMAAEAALRSEGVFADVYNQRFIKPIDEDYLLEILCGYELAYFVEEANAAGGLGEYLAGLVARNLPELDFRPCGVPDSFIPQGERSELLELCGLSGRSLATKVKARLKAREQSALENPRG